MKREYSWAWRPTGQERGAIQRGSRRFAEWHKQLAAQIEAERRAQRERRA